MLHDRRRRLCPSAAPSGVPPERVDDARHRLPHAVLAGRRWHAVRARGIVCAVRRFACALLRPDLDLRPSHRSAGDRRNAAAIGERGAGTAPALRWTETVLSAAALVVAADLALGVDTRQAALPDPDAGRVSEFPRGAQTR